MRQLGTAWTFALIMGATLVVLAGCSGEPDPDFGAKREQQQAARAGDPYAPLSDAPRPFRYLQASEDQRPARVTAYAQSLRSSYSSLLGKLDSEEVPGGLEALALACKAAYVEASRSDAGVLKGDKHVAETLAALIQCRTQALAVVGEQNMTHAALLKRFASTGVVLVGMTTMAAGDVQVGLDIWRKGDAWVQEDRPEFELTLDAFR